MLTIVQLEKSNPKFIRNAVLDAPTSGGVVDGDMYFRGWVVLDDESDKYFLEVRRDEEKILEVKPTVNRDDVQKAFSLKSPHGEIFKGFDFILPNVQENNVIQIYVANSKRKELWIALSLVECDSSDSDSLFDFLSGDGTSLGDVLVKDKAISQVSFSKLERISRESLDNEPGFYSDNRKLNLDFLDFIENRYFLRNLLDEIGSDVGKGLKNFCGFEGLALVNSFFVGGVNYLVFSSPHGFFYIGQFLHTVDFVVFPRQRVVYTPRHCHFEIRHVKKLFDMALYSPEYISSAHSVATSSSLNLLINGVSPYHYFYDTINNFSSVQDISLNEVYVFSGQVYFPIRSFVESLSPEKIITKEAFEKVQRNDEIYSIIGYPFKYLNNAEINELDKYIVEEVQLYPDSSRVADVLAKVDKKALVVWVGISSQKRSWLNQLEVLIDVCGDLIERFGNVAYVFDGMTSNVYESDAWDADFTKDNELVSKLIEELSPRATVVNMVGYSSLEKLKIAKAIDFYIANYSTGSMYPSRFYKKPGVSHLSNKMMHVVRDLHLHANNFCVPEDFVKDIPDAENPRVDFVSYEIDKRAFMEYVNKILGSTVFA